MATHSSTLAWKIPWTEEPGRPQSMESQRVGHDLATTPPPPLCTRHGSKHFTCILALDPLALDPSNSKEVLLYSFYR